MSSSPAVTSFFPPAPDHFSPVPRSPHASSYDWGQSRELTTDLLDSRERGLELSHSQERTPPREIISTTSSRRPASGMQKVYSPSPLTFGQPTTADTMQANPKSAAPIEPFVRDGSDDSLSNSFRRSNRWSYNGAEKLITSSVPNWDLVDELGKLKLTNGSSDDDGSTTPPKTIVTELQIQETSPLDTSSSDTSLDSMSPANADSLNLVSHNRGASTDTLSSENSSRSQVLLNSLKSTAFTTDLTKDRPRSFSGAINDAELRRLQNIPTPTQLPESFRDDRNASPLTRDASGGDGKAASNVNVESYGGPPQPMFPSLTAYPPAPQQNFVQGHGFHQMPVGRPEDLHLDTPLHSKHSMDHGHGRNPSFSHMGGNGPMRNGQFSDHRYGQQQMRGGGNAFQQGMPVNAQAPQPLLPSPTNFTYPGMAGGHAHHNSMSLGNQQQLYDMMMPPMDPAVNRAQQTFRAGHQHSASDPASLREAALLMNGGMTNVAPYPGSPPLYPTMPGMANGPVYPNQYFAGHAQQQQQYGQEMVNVMNMNRLQQQFTGNSTSTATSPPAYDQTIASQNAQNQLVNGNPAGPSANNRKLTLYKTELCRSWEEKGSCRYGVKCQFAHGEDEIRKVQRHPKYKTEICRTFWVSGSCPYGKRCCFIHTELPANGTPPGAEGVNPPPPPPDGRGRSVSTTSDPNDAPVSILQRINAGRGQQSSSSNATTPTATSAVDGGQNYQYQRQSTGPLRLDTTVVDTVTTKPTKSAYPSFGNSSMQALSPGPVTAGPEFGRQNIGMVDMPLNQRMNSSQSSNPRHSFNGSEGVNYNQSSRNVSGGSSPFGMLGESTGNSSGGHGHGHSHSRSGSASNWGSFSQKSSHLGGSPYAHTPSPGNELGGAGGAGAGSPWGSQDLSAGSARLNERAWP